MRNVNSYFLLVLAAMLGACSAANNADVTIEIIPGQKNSLTLQGAARISEEDSAPRFRHPRQGESFNTPVGSLAISNTGLLTSNTCYVLHVTGPGLMDDRFKDQDDGENQCPVEIPKVEGLGLIPERAYAYGAEAKVVVPAGADRRIDLLGFINPYGANDPGCNKALRIVKMENPNATDPKDRWHLRFFYGEYAIDEEASDGQNDDRDPPPPLPPGTLLPPDGTGTLGFFAASPRANLAPGRQSISLSSLPWMLKDDGTDQLERPAEYGGCGGGGSSSYNSPTFPPLNPADNDTNANLDYILSGMTTGFLEIKCKSNETVNLSVKGVNAIAKNIGSATCTSERVVFNSISYNGADIGIHDDPNSDCDQGPHGCVRFTVQYSGGTVSENSKDFVGQIWFSDRYGAVRHNSYDQGIPNYLNLLGSGSDNFSALSALSHNIVSFRRNGTQRELIVQSFEDEGDVILGADDTVHLNKYLFTNPTRTEGSLIGPLDWNGDSSIVDSGTATLTGTPSSDSNYIAKPLGMKFFDGSSNSLWGLFGISADLFFRGWTGSTWSANSEEVASVNVSVDSDNGSFSYLENFPTVSSIYFTFDDLANLTAYGATHGLAGGEILIVSNSPGPYCNHSLDMGVELEVEYVDHEYVKLKIDTDNNGTYDSYIQEGTDGDGWSCTFYAIKFSDLPKTVTFKPNANDVSSLVSSLQIPLLPPVSSFEEKHIFDNPNEGSLVVAYDPSATEFKYTKCESNSSCADPNLQRVPSTFVGTAVYDFDLLLFEERTLLTLGMSYKRIQLRDTGPVDLGNMSFHPEPGTPSNWKIKAMRNTDIGVPFSNFEASQAIASVYDSGTHKLYRTKDGGANWYLVKEFSNNIKVLDLAVGLNSRASDNGVVNDYGAFLILIEETVADHTSAQSCHSVDNHKCYRLVVEDGQHGF